MEYLTTDNDSLPPLNTLSSTETIQIKKQKHIILDSLYEKHTPQEIVQQCKHLTQTQQTQFVTILSKYSTLFNGKLKVYPQQQLHLETDPSI